MDRVTYNNIPIEKIFPKLKKIVASIIEDYTPKEQEKYLLTFREADKKYFRTRGGYTKTLVIAGLLKVYEIHCKKTTKEYVSKYAIEKLIEDTSRFKGFFK